jgi:ribosomal protein S18 acetylase RimI-like enzyme
MTIRDATPADNATLVRFMEALMDELWQRPFPRPEPFDPEKDLDDRVVLLAEDEEPVGLAFGPVYPHGVAHLNVVYVVPGRRREGIAKALLVEFVSRARAQGAQHMTLDVDTTNEAGRALWQRLGFGEWARRLASPLDELESRLGRAAGGESRGSIYVQTDDSAEVEAAAAKYLPRFGGSDAHVLEPRNGWTQVRADLLDRDRRALNRLASELSNATAAVACTLALEDGQLVRYALYERGSIVDEYQSVPEYYGPVPPGDVVALGANATVVARLTGADPARVRAVARIAASPDELPPGPELLQEIAELMGLESPLGS